MRARELLGPSGPLARAFPGYEDREGQLLMADAVERALEEGSALLCEAGTGTGKTLAYLVPAILSGLKVVVSTATKALEEQVFVKDLGIVREHLGLDVDAAMAKGLSNYVCMRRYEELRKSPGEAADAEVRRALPVVEAWVPDSETGDVAELVTLGEGHAIWREIASSSETRIGASCDHYDRCFVTRMKRELERAHLLVVNHHLFFADLAVKTAAAARGGPAGGALPPYDAVIFDEAHELEDIATDFFGVRVSEARIESLLRDSDRAFVAAGLADRLLGKGEGTALTMIARERARAMFAELARRAPRSGREREGEGKATLPRDVFSGALLEAYHGLDATLEALSGYAESHAVAESVKLVAQRAAALRDDIARVADPATNRVAWIDVRPRGVAVGASPIDLGDVFRERVFDRIGAVIMTSATLTASSGREPTFKFLRRRLGVAVGDAKTPIAELLVASPFDYARSALLYTPRDLPEPNDESFVSRAAERALELIAISKGGAFVLCTSVRSMRAFARALFGKTPSRPLVQGDAPKGQLLARFRSSSDAVLVATMSFWEGVDVPGDALRLVVIDKLPFAVPSDPIVAARCRALEESGENPFSAYSVPEAAITLKQGFGRLIRTRHDRGVVAVLDRRVRTKGYGHALLQSLPPARRTDRLEDVAEFFALAAAPEGR